MADQPVSCNVDANNPIQKYFLAGRSDQGYSGSLVFGIGAGGGTYTEMDEDGIIKQEIYIDQFKIGEGAEANEIRIPQEFAVTIFGVSKETTTKDFFDSVESVNKTAYAKAEAGVLILVGECKAPLFEETLKTGEKPGYNEYPLYNKVYEPVMNYIKDLADSPRVILEIMQGFITRKYKL